MKPEMTRKAPLSAADGALGSAASVNQPWSTTWRGARRAAGLAVLVAGHARAQRVLIPMDDGQQNHLKAYGLTYRAIKAGTTAEWLLYYRGGSFLLADTPDIQRQARLDGVSFEPIDDSPLAELRSQIGQNNMEAVPLEKAPKVAVYTPSDALPWDDA